MILHPLIIHFPIVFLTLYCGMEVLMQFAWKNHPTALFIRKWSLWFGTLTVFLAIFTGKQAQEALGNFAIIRFHESIAYVVNVVFVCISIIYLIEVPTTPLTRKYLSKNLLEILPKISITLQRFRVTLILAIIGFLLIAAVWSVGASIRRGTDGDPIARFIIQTWGGSELYQ